MFRVERAMDIVNRQKHTARLFMTLSAFDRANYVKRMKLFRSVGDNCMFMFRKLPLYPKLISVGNNVHLASNVRFITHDLIHSMLNTREGEKKYNEYVGCISIGDNVFVGANTTILYNVDIPSDTIIGANSLVNKTLDKPGVYAGVPARYICSLDEFIGKRSDYSIEVVKKHARLSEKTVEECWKNHEEKYKNR